MNEIQQAGIRNKSFELSCSGGTIWCEHLDSRPSSLRDALDRLSELMYTVLVQR